MNSNFKNEISKSLPTHLGIIMDGNGRWAQERGLHRTMGHARGVKVVKKIIQSICDSGIPYVSLFTFSTENWKRAQEEVSYLMNLIATHLKQEFAFYKKNRIRVIHSGSIKELPTRVQEEIYDVVEKTRDFDGTTVNLAINYGGQDELIRGMRAMVASMETLDPELITKESFAQFLDAHEAPDMDFLIRTGGEQRLSNFMLWKSAYAELYFSDKYWPDWTNEDLQLSLDEYAKRQRRFGGVPKLQTAGPLLVSK